MQTITEKTSTDRARDERMLVPAADIFETPGEYTLKIEMPGVTRENLDVVIADDELEIRGTVKENPAGDKKLIYGEYNLYNYYRKFKVGSDIDRQKIGAILENGVLTLKLEKHEQVKPRKIDIQVK